MLYGLNKVIDSIEANHQDIQVPTLEDLLETVNSAEWREAMAQRRGEVKASDCVLLPGVGNFLVILYLLNLLVQPLVGLLVGRYNIKKKYK